jgi:hypothetical protein
MQAVLLAAVCSMGVVPHVAFQSCQCTLQGIKNSRVGMMLLSAIRKESLKLCSAGTYVVSQVEAQLQQLPNFLHT